MAIEVVDCTEVGTAASIVASSIKECVRNGSTSPPEIALVPKVVHGVLDVEVYIGKTLTAAFSYPDATPTGLEQAMKMFAKQFARSMGERSSEE